MVYKVNMGLISFQNFKSHPDLGNCGYCLKRLNNGQPLVAHEGRGQLHPMHLACIKLWAEKQSTCPYCNEKFEPNSLLSFKERIFIPIKMFARPCKRVANQSVHYIQTNKKTILNDICIGLFFYTLFTLTNTVIDQILINDLKEEYFFKKNESFKKDVKIISCLFGGYLLLLFNFIHAQKQYHNFLRRRENPHLQSYFLNHLSCRIHFINILIFSMNLIEINKNEFLSCSAFIIASTTGGMLDKHHFE